jgi:hypothetical protein
MPAMRLRVATITSRHAPTSLLQEARESDRRLPARAERSEMVFRELAVISPQVGERHKEELMRIVSPSLLKLYGVEQTELVLLPLIAFIRSRIVCKPEITKPECAEVV